MSTAGLGRGCRRGPERFRMLAAKIMPAMVNHVLKSPRRLPVAPARHSGTHRGDSGLRPRRRNWRASGNVVAIRQNGTSCRPVPGGGE